MSMPNAPDAAPSNHPKKNDYREGKPTGAIPRVERRKPVKSRVPAIFIQTAARLGEAGVIVLAGALIFLLHGERLGEIFGASTFAWLVMGVTFCFAAGAEFSSLYKIRMLGHIYRGLGLLVSTWSAVAGIACMALFFPLGASPAALRWLVDWYFIGLAGLVTARALSQSYIAQCQRDHRLTRRVVVVGGGKDADRLSRLIQKSGRNDIEVCGFFDDRQDERSESEVNGLPKLGTVNELLRFARSNRVDLLIVALPQAAQERVNQLVSKLWVLPVDIRLALPDADEDADGSRLGELALKSLYDKPMSGWDLAVKTVEDRVLGALALLLTAPLFLIIAAAIKLDSKGPVFFKQRRFGFNNELIEVYKFRSLKHEDADANASKLVTVDDDRVTKVGGFLRRTSLDELPQLFSVIKGEMSMVGPRPHAVLAKAAGDLYGEAVDGYFARHRVKPGMTGWAQINGWRGETDTHDKIAKRTEYDLYYIENWSLLFDLYILIKTPWALLKGENAY